MGSKLLNLKIKLDSNGTNPAMLEYLINKNLVYFIAVDVKYILEFESHNKTVGNCIDKKMCTKIINSINLIDKSKANYEFRTTVIKGTHTVKQINWLKNKFKPIINFNNLIRK